MWCFRSDPGPDVLIQAYGVDCIPRWECFLFQQLMYYFVNNLPTCDICSQAVHDIHRSMVICICI